MDNLVALVVYMPLILLLGSNDFRTRESTQSRLAKLDGTIAALEWGSRHADPEIAARSRVLAKDWYQRNADALTDNVLFKIGWKEWPFLIGYHAGQDEQEFYLHQEYHQKALNAGFKSGSNHNWESYREACRLIVRDKLLSKKPYAAWLQRQCEYTLMMYKQNNIKRK